MEERRVNGGIKTKSEGLIYHLSRSVWRIVWEEPLEIGQYSGQTLE